VKFFLVTNALVTKLKRIPQAVNHHAAVGGGEQILPNRKPPQRVDLTPHLGLELSLECEVDCEKPEPDKAIERLPA